MGQAKLIYVSDDQPGITRHRAGRGFSYRAPDGTIIRKGPERSRLEALAVPPAYEDVWMCATPNGHLLATGRDQRRRKQYRYHPEWAAQQAQTKFDSLVAFGHALPRLRGRVTRDLQEDAGTQRFALAAAVTLIDRTAMRVGSPDYTRENGSYGAVTLRGKHLSLDGNEIRLTYRAKGGKNVRRRLTDRTLARVLHKIDDLPGAEVLSWIDDSGTPHPVSSTVLNGYISDMVGAEGFTAKTFRTWIGSRAAYDVAEAGGATIKAMSEQAAEQLNNTPTIARKSYIHPLVIDLAGMDAVEVVAQRTSGLFASEARMLAYLENEGSL